jgi:plastocyanin
MKKPAVIIGIIILIVVIVGIALAMNNKVAPNQSTSSSTSSNVSAAAIITYSASGFSPATVTVKSGDTVAIKNTTSADMQLDSNPHPVHTDDTDLNVGLVSAGQTRTFVVTKKGSFGYHNHLNPSDTGKIVIQ